jgi:hypothetical protein
MANTTNPVRRTYIRNSVTLVTYKGRLYGLPTTALEDVKEVTVTSYTDAELQVTLPDGSEATIPYFGTHADVPKTPRTKVPNLAAAWKCMSEDEKIRVTELIEAALKKNSTSATEDATDTGEDESETTTDEIAA